MLKNSTTPPTIQLENIQFSYKNRVLFENLNLTLEAGKITCLLGPSGTGKTSLLRLIARLSPTSKEEKFQGRIDCSNEIAYMAQDDLLLPWLTALDNALLMTKLNNFSATQKKNLITQAKQLFKQLGLIDCENKFPRQLSGGMRQRVALARTLLADKPIVLMDEPFSGLDTITRFQIQSLAAELLKNKTVLLVTHDLFESLRLAHEIYILSGEPAQLSHHLKLSSPTPRDLADPEVIHHQAQLFDALLNDHPEITR